MRSPGFQNTSSRGGRARTLLLLLATGLAAICLQAQNSNNNTAPPPRVYQVDPRTLIPVPIPTDAVMTHYLMAHRAAADANAATPAPGSAPAAVDSAGMVNNGGFIIDGPSCMPVHVYLIWYGNWSGNTATTIIPNFINGLNGSSYMNILTTYSGQDVRSGNGFGSVTNQVVLGGQFFDNYSEGTSLSAITTQLVVGNALTSLGLDNFGVYFVLTSADVAQTGDPNGDPGFCNAYCGYHSDWFQNNIDIKYAFVGNPDHCGSGSGCFLGTNAPNGNRAADAMTSVVAHELAEALTDPRAGNTWTDPNGLEVGDKCEQFFTDLQLPTGTFFTQALWLNSGAGGCAFSFSGAPPPPPPPTGGGGDPPPDPPPGCSVKPLPGQSAGTTPGCPQ